ncbi:MAG: nucleotidyltransferase domain-containing protein [Bacteroidales bacterium]|nr:nucleotidyltransferase domain-containing protein [Bacteroidales bacterium]
MKNSFGIYNKSYQLIIDTLKSFSEIEQAIMFGSRAMGNEKKGSDIDIAVSGVNISAETVNKLSTILNSMVPTPYYIDVVHFEKISNHELRKHIEEYGVVFYDKDGDRDIR